MLLLLLCQVRLTVVHVRITTHAAIVVVHRHDCALLIDCLFKLRVRLLLDGLCILQLFDQLHLEHLHLHDLLLFLLDHSFLLGNLSRNFLSSLIDLLFAELFDLNSLNTLLLLHGSVLELLFSHLISNRLLVSSLMLLVNKFGLLGFLFLLEHDRLSNLHLFILTVSAHSSQLLSVHFLSVCLLLHGLSLATRTLLVHHLRLDYVAGAPLRLLDLLPRLHFLLLKERNSVGEQLRILLNAV